LEAKLKTPSIVVLTLGLILGSGSAASAQAAGICVRHVSVPKYPVVAHDARIEGTVDVEVDAGMDGIVHSVKASGAHNLLNESAQENMKEWTFCPSLQALHFTIKYVYRLEGEPVFQPESTVSIDLPIEVKIVSRPLQTMW
jgi:TonB family protein